MGKGKAYYRIMYGLFFLLLLGGGALRMVLRLGFTDPSTDFLENAGILPALLFGVLAVGLIGMPVLNQFRKSGQEYQLPRGGVLLSVLAILIGLALALYMYQGLPTPLGQKNPEVSVQVVRMIRIINVTLGYLSAAVFVGIGVAGLLGASLPGILPLIPAVWQITLLLSRFNGYHSVLHIHDYLLAVLFMMFAAMFFLGHARCVSGMGRKDGRNYVISMGLCAGACGLLLVIPIGVSMLMSGSFAPDPLISLEECLYILLMSVYALLFVRSYTKSMQTI